MGALDELLDRNRRIARGSGAELPKLPRRRLVVLACMDHRVDPAEVLGLDLGDAAVIRNPGGRVTPAFLQQLEVLGRVFPQVGAGEERFELALIQHTECGFARLSGDDEHRELVSGYFGVAPERLAERAPGDPYEGVRADIELLARDERVPAELAVSGLVYVLESRLLELVERREPLRAQA